MVIYYYLKNKIKRLQYDAKHYKKYEDHVVVGIPDKEDQAIIYKIPLKEIREIRTDEQDKLMKKNERDPKKPVNNLTNY